MSNGRRRFSMKQPVVVVDVGCGCRRQKLFALLSSLRPKPRSPKTPHSLSSTSLWPSTATSMSTSTTTMMNSAYSPSSHGEPINASPPQSRAEEEKWRRRRRRMKKPASASEESVAVVKESSEPYVDFRESMVQMIVENEIYAWDDLNDLLHRFLSLNSPRHHHLILRAFADLWTGVFSPPSPCSYY